MCVLLLLSGIGRGSGLRPGCEAGSLKQNTLSLLAFRMKLF